MKVVALIVLAGVVGTAACEKTGDDHPVLDRRPRRSAEELAARDAALVALDEAIGGVQRERSPVEAPTALTNAYVALELAYGFALVGDGVRANEHVATARAVLDGLAADPVHATLLALYRERIAAALAGAPSDTPPTVTAMVHLEALDRMHRYQVDRLREVSTAANGGVPGDAIAAFARKQRDARGPEAAQLAAIADPAARAVAIAKLVDGVIAASDGARSGATGASRGGATAAGDVAGASDGAAASIATARGADVVSACLEAMPGANDAADLARVAPLVGRVPPSMRAEVAATAANAASRSGSGELVASLIDQALAAAAWEPPATDPDGTNADGSPNAPDGVPWAVRETLRVARRAGLGRDALGARLAVLSGAKDPSVAIAANGGRASIAYLDVARTRLATVEMTQTVRTNVTRALASAYANAPVAVALPALADLAAKTLPRTTDSFSTNSHFALSVIAVVDAVVLGIAGDD